MAEIISMHNDNCGRNGNNGGDNGIMMMPSLIDNTATGGEKNDHTSR
jgi:hypothetical protein